jgi:sugar (pentulose or hexulose) kinase
VSRIAHITTLAGYIHYMLTGVNAVGVGEASGIFPIDSETLTYDAANMDCTAAWREVRPLPEGGGFFENVWRSYRENGNVY